MEDYILNKFGLMFPEFGERTTGFIFFDNETAKINVKGYGPMTFIYRGEHDWILSCNNTNTFKEDI